MIDFIRSNLVGRHGTPTTQVVILEGTQSAILETRATHTTSVECTKQPTMTGHKPNSHKKRAPTRHKYKQTLPSEKKRRVSNSSDPLVGQVVTQTQPDSFSPPSSISASVSTRSTVSVPSLTAVVNRLFTSPTRTVGSPLADDAAIAEMASSGPLRSLNFGKSELLQKHKKKEK